MAFNLQINPQIAREYFFNNPQLRQGDLAKGIEVAKASVRPSDPSPQSDVERIAVSPEQAQNFMHGLKNGHLF